MGGVRVRAGDRVRVRVRVRARVRVRVKVRAWVRVRVRVRVRVGVRTCESRVRSAAAVLSLLQPFPLISTREQVSPNLIA